MSSPDTERPVAIVTGGTRGIGSGIAEALAENGYDLILSYNSNKEAAEAFKTNLVSSQEKLCVECVGGDISLVSTRDAIFDCLDSKFSGRKLGAVIHNAGQYVGITSSNSDDLSATQATLGNGSLLTKNQDGKEELDLKEMHYYQRMYGDAFIDLCERGLARFSEDGGFLIGISSPGVGLGYRTQSAHSLSLSGKAIMEFAMRPIAVNAAPKNVNCNVIIPGVTASDAWGKLAELRGVQKGEMLEQVASRSPMQKVIALRQIGDAVAFLCSPSGRVVTGAILPVDGGLHLV